MAMFQEISLEHNIFGNGLLHWPWNRWFGNRSWWKCTFQV